MDFCTIDAGRPVDDTRKYTTRGVARIIISVEVRAKAMRYEVWGGRCTPYREGVWEGLCPLQGKINSFCETYAIWCIITHLTGSIAHALPLWLPPCVTQLVVAMFSKLYTFEARQVSAVQAYVLDGRTSWQVAVPPPNSTVSNGEVISVVTSSLLQQLDSAWWRSTPLLHVNMALTVLPVDAARDPPRPAPSPAPARQYRPAAAAAADDVYVTDGVDGG